MDSNLLFKTVTDVPALFVNDNPIKLTLINKPTIKHLGITFVETLSLKYLISHMKYGILCISTRAYSILKRLIASFANF